MSSSSDTNRLVELALGACNASYSWTTIESVSTDTQVYVTIEEGVLAVAFPGTSSLVDWAANMNSLLQFFPYKSSERVNHPSLTKVYEEGLKWVDEDKGVLVQRGVLISYDSIRDKLIALVSELIAGKRGEGAELEILVTGHSLGGAIANLCALDILINTKLQPTLITFGAQKVGNKVYRDLMNSRLKDRHLRFQNKWDVVPLLPFCALFKRVHHAGKLIHLEDRWRGLVGSHHIDTYLTLYRGQPFQQTTGDR